MTSQILTEQQQAAWVALLRSHAEITRWLDAQLEAEHGLSLSEYEVLLHLWRSDDHSMRRIDLAHSVLLTPSGITRMMRRLQGEGYITNRNCESDARVTWAVLTDVGRTKLEAARESHLADVRRIFASQYSDEEMLTLAEMLSRIARCPSASQ